MKKSKIIALIVIGAGIYWYKQREWFKTANVATPSFRLNTATSDEIIPTGDEPSTKPNLIYV